MALSVSLERLVHAIAGSIMKAQHLVEMAQLSNLRAYFNDKNEPITVDVQLPSMHLFSADAKSGAESQSDKYRVPVISLVPHGSLSISEASITLDVELGNVQQEDAPPEGYATLADLAKGKEPITPKLLIDPESGGVAKKTGGNIAHLSLKLTGAEPTEGLARLLNEVIKSQGRLPPEEKPDTNTEAGK